VSSNEHPPLLFALKALDVDIFRAHPRLILFHVVRYALAYLSRRTPVTDTVTFCLPVLIVQRLFLMSLAIIACELLDHHQLIPEIPVQCFKIISTHPGVSGFIAAFIGRTR
jgi:hypothetical protein